MTLSIVIPNFNGEQLIKKNFPGIFQAIKRSNDQKIIEIIVIDDGSTDQSVQEIKNQQSANRNIAIHLLQNKKNLGFSSSVNLGVKQATGDIVILLNTDVYPETDFLKAAIPHFENKSIFAVGFLDKSIEGNKIIERGRGIGYWYKGFVLHGRGAVDKNDTFWVSCGSGAFRRDMWNILNGLDELYNPFYWEDIDLSYRARKAGFTVIFEPKSQVTHEHAIGSIKSLYSSSKVKTIAYRNQFYFVWKNITDIKLMMSHFFWLFNHVFQALLTSDMAFLGGLFQAIVHLPTVISHRKKQMKLYKKADQELLERKA